MIKLELTEKPATLTDKLVEALTERFQTTGEDVWNSPFLRQAVLAISFNKCVYSESMLGEEGKYMEVDHFRPKSIYPQEVVRWGNLLAANKKCNTTKGDWDTVAEPIINPLIDEPKTHLFLKGYRFYSKTAMGERTIEQTALNDRAHFTKKRAAIGFEICETLEDIWKQIEEDVPGFSKVRGRKKRILQNFKNLCQEGNRKQEYAATVAAVILEDPNFEQLCNFFQQNELWDVELSNLVQELQFCALLRSS
jgi:5-methylcytosine-specific restriction endonuclease McrA